MEQARMENAKVVNRTDGVIDFREGNAGVLQSRRPLLQPNQDHEVKTKPGTDTYREYEALRVTNPMTSLTREHSVNLNSDYFADNQIVYIRTDDQGKLYRDGIRRDVKLETQKIVNNVSNATIIISETVDLLPELNSTQTVKRTGCLTKLKEVRPDKDATIKLAKADDIRMENTRFLVNTDPPSANIAPLECTGKEFVSIKGAISIYLAPRRPADPPHIQNIVAIKLCPRSRSWSSIMSSWGRQ